MDANTEYMNVSRDKSIAEVLKMVANAKKKFHEFDREIHDEELGELCFKVSSAMVNCITELTELENFLYTMDIVNWTEGETKSTVEIARIR